MNAYDGNWVGKDTHYLDKFGQGFTEKVTFVSETSEVISFRSYDIPVKC